MGAQAAALREGAVTKWEKVLRALLWFIAAESAFFIVIYLYRRDRQRRRVPLRRQLGGQGRAAGGARRRRRDRRAALGEPGGPAPDPGPRGPDRRQRDHADLGRDQPDPKVFSWGSDATAFAVSWMAIDAVIIAALFLIHRAAQRERLALRYLTPLEFSTLRALAEVLIHGDDEKVDADKIARNADGYLADLQASRKWLVRASFIGLSLFPLLTLRPPFAMMAPATRLRYAKKRFERRYLPWPLGSIAQPMVRAAQQFVFLGYYGDEASHAASGYVPFSKRGPVPDRSDATITATKPPEDGKTIKPTSWCRQRRRAARSSRTSSRRSGTCWSSSAARTCGPPSSPRTRSRCTSSSTTRARSSSSRDFRFSVAAGHVRRRQHRRQQRGLLRRRPTRCCGAGTTTGTDAGLEPGKLAASCEAVRGRMLDVQQRARETAHAGRPQVRGGHPAARARPRPSSVTVNIDECAGCGYCNIGCAYGKKMSMLDSVLPLAQHKKGVEIMPGCKVDRDPDERQAGDRRRLRRRRPRGAHPREDRRRRRGRASTRAGCSSAAASSDRAPDATCTSTSSRR